MSTVSVPPRVVCGMCGREVERVEWWRDDLRRTIEVRVYCHGEVDAAYLTDADLVARDTIAEAVAFRTKRVA